jgi:ribonuclease BN (tRNA processing enzyme)
MLAAKILRARVAVVAPLEVYGPRGVAHMTEHVMEAYREDFAARKRDRNLYTVGAFPEGHAVNAHEIEPGVVYKDANVTVAAFATKHTMESYGYRFDTKVAASRSRATPIQRRPRSMCVAAATC